MTYLSATQVSKLAGVSRQAILQAISSGRLAAVKIGHGWMIAQEAAQSYVGARDARNKLSNIQKTQEK